MNPYKMIVDENDLGHTFGEIEKNPEDHTAFRRLPKNVQADLIYDWLLGLVALYGDAVDELIDTPEESDVNVH
jgi:hypothetical protein